MSAPVFARGAIFSDCGRYRYRLWRRWSDQAPYCNFLMLNPSTADVDTNDPTVERCQRRALSWGYGGLQVTNLFALRSTDPRALYAHADPVGIGNDLAIVQAALQSGIVVCAWGGHGKHRARATVVREMLGRFDHKLHALRINADGNPAHPLYLPYSLTPTTWRPHEQIDTPAQAGRDHHGRGATEGGL